MKKQVNKIAKNITKQMEEARIADYIDFLEQENQELKKLNIAQVRENAQIRIEKAKIEKQLSIIKERIIEIINKEIFVPDCIRKENSEYHIGFRDCKTLYAESKLKAIRKINKLLGDDKNEI